MSQSLWDTEIEEPQISQEAPAVEDTDFFPEDPEEEAAELLNSDVAFEPQLVRPELVAPLRAPEPGHEAATAPEAALEVATAEAVKTEPAVEPVPEPASVPEAVAPVEEVHQPLEAAAEAVAAKTAETVETVAQEAASLPAAAPVAAPAAGPVLVQSAPAAVAPEPVAEPEVVALSSDEFSALEDRILRAVNLVRRERVARTEAEERAGRAESRAEALDLQLAETLPQVARLQAENQTLRSERDQVRQRVERLLSELDTLEM